MFSVPTRDLYAMLAVFDVAYYANGRAVQSRDVAERQGIPHRYLEQILCRLTRAGVVKAKRGPHGGYQLADRPEAVRMSHVLKALDGFAERGGGRPKRDKVASPLANAVQRAFTKEALTFFERMTVADLCKEAEALGVAKKRPGDLMYFI